MAALQYVDVPGYAAVLFRDTYKNLTKPKALLDRSFEWLVNTDAEWSGDKMRWGFPKTGASISFSYLEGPRDHFNHQSAEYQFVGMDEVVSIRENQAMYLHSRLRRLKGVHIPIRFRTASNPPAREQLATGAWVKRRYVDSITRPAGIVFISAKMADNPHLDTVDYEISLDSVDPITREQLKKGDWEIRATGNIFDRTSFTIIDRPMTDVVTTVRYWDKAATEPEVKRLRRTKTTDPDWTVGLKMSRTARGMYVVEHVIRFRKNPPETETLMRQTAELDGKRVRIREEQEGGSAGKTVISNNTRFLFPGFDYKGVPQHANKYVRAVPFANMAASGNVYVVAGEWNAAFFDELELFPDGEHDDQVDTASGAFADVALGDRARIREVAQEDYVVEDQLSGDDEIVARGAAGATVADGYEPDFEEIAEMNARRVYGNEVVDHWNEVEARG
jgi:predicted phage terminase large subunit-like protein